MGDSEKEQPKIGPLDWLGLSNAPQLRVARPLGAFLGFYLVGLFIVALFATMAVLMSTFSSLDSDTGPSLGVGTLIIGVLGAPFLIWRTMVAQTTVDLAKENHVTDMINKAVEGLGAQKISKYQVRDASGQVRQHKDKSYVTVERSEPNIEVRIGAILALERLAKNNLDVHIQIMEILTAYIRENAKASEAEALPECPSYSAESDHGHGEELFTWLVRLEFKLEDVKPRADIQMALTVIGRREPEQKERERNGVPKFADASLVPPAFPSGSGNRAGWIHAMAAFHRDVTSWNERTRRYTLDLRGVNLRGADFGGGDFQNARLEGAHLERAELGGAHLEGANLNGAHLEGSDLGGAHLESALLINAHLQGANLSEAHLEGVVLFEAHLERAVLARVHLVGAFISSTHLEQADLRQAHLEGAFFDKAHLKETFLFKAHLEGALFEGAELEGAKALSSATITGAAFRDMDLTNLPEIWVRNDQIFSDASARLPDNVRPGDDGWPDHWKEEQLDWELRNDQPIDHFKVAWHAWLNTLSAEPTPPSP